MIVSSVHIPATTSRHLDRRLYRLTRLQIIVWSMIRSPARLLFNCATLSYFAIIFSILSLCLLFAVLFKFASTLVLITCASRSIVTDLSSVRLPDYTVDVQKLQSIFRIKSSQAFPQSLPCSTLSLQLFSSSTFGTTSRLSFPMYARKHIKPPRHGVVNGAAKASSDKNR